MVSSPSFSASNHPYWPLRRLQVGVYRIEAERKSAEELFVLFRKIVDMYILAGSEMEINIETAMRKKVLLVRTT